MPNLYTCCSCGHTFDHDMYEVCPECQRHPDDDIDEDIFGLMCEHGDDDEPSPYYGDLD